jgi:hypothetical protein
MKVRRLIGRSTIVVATVLTGFVAGSAVPSGAAPSRVALPHPIYFWNSTVAVIRGPGQLPAPEAIRPSVIGMFADGSWAIIHLRWTGWGSSIAHATGTSSASNGIPNQAEGKRIKRPATVALSHPGQFHGREVYRCFTLTVPSKPTSNQHLCLTRSGLYWYLAPAQRAASSHVQYQATCKNDGHTYISGKTATVQGQKAKFVGTLVRFHPCGEDGGYFTSNNTTITLTLTPASKITVFKNELDPSTTKTVTAAHFPRAFRMNKDEPIYQYSGPKSAVNKLSEHFVS